MAGGGAGAAAHSGAGVLGFCLAVVPIAETAGCRVQTRARSNLAGRRAATLRLDLRSAGGNTETLPVYAAELVGLEPDAIIDLLVTHF